MKLHCLRGIRNYFRQEFIQDKPHFDCKSQLTIKYNQTVLYLVAAGFLVRWYASVSQTRRAFRRITYGKTAAQNVPDIFPGNNQIHKRITYFNGLLEF